jgi:uncharacterized membrane protein
MQKDKPDRLTFLDIMRFIALFMMIQGHTVYAMLDKEIRDGGSFGIGIWTQLRGYTAPFFMVIAGAVFTFLLLQQDRRLVSGNIRIKKGLIRVGTLLFWGYLLRFQLEAIYKPISQGMMDNALAVDVLHIIGLGLLTVIGVFIITRKYLGLLSLVFLSLFFTVSLSSPYITQKNFHQEPEPLLSYNEIGVLLDENNDFYADSLGIADNDGLIILDVRPGSRAEQLGLKQNDVIVGLGYQHICNLDDLDVAEARQRYGRYANFEIVRGMIPMSITYTYERKARIFPNIFTLWMNSVKTKAQKSSPFPIFPWLSYILFGAFFGALLAWMKDKGNLNRFLEIKLLLIGGSLIALSEIGDVLEIQRYGMSNFWGHIEGMGASANLIFHRIGVVILVGAVCAFLSRFITKLPNLMNQMSRNTLWLYVGHLIILYWIRPIISLERFGVGMTLVFVICMYALMISQTLIIEKKNQIGSWKGYLLHVKTKLSRGNSLEA